ncbi:MFS transporter [Nitrogeniibacter aestuarii]|uniref:hypothetical protein n=1 Tax=Nitrogeniibacter aestuarii TaxID=2815343 RepID=UPI001D129442|nr:hypothetical protein [Nitrogeniibacter aestuarii]
MSAANTESSRLAREAYTLLADDSEGRICKDIPESACNDQPGNFMRHVLSLGATKSADGFADAKLILAWLFGALGVPAWLTGLLVPVREAGALLPQLGIAAAIRGLAVRKWVWVIGSVGQGLAVIGIAIAALSLEGTAAGVVIVGLLAIAALARGACSVSYKDVLGKTVSKSTRGTATGAAGSASSVIVLLFGLALAFGIFPRTTATVAAVLLLAGGLWLGAAALFATLTEAPGATEGGGNALTLFRKQFALLGEDAQLRRFILVRALLVSTALSPPFLLAVSGEAGKGALDQLGGFIVASSLASFVSAYVWGRLSDRSSRKVLMLAGIVAAVALAGTVGMALVAPELLEGVLVPAALLFVLMVAHQGVRLGRSTHIVDMADADQRANYTALSNTVIGVVLIAGGAFGVLAQVAGEVVVLAVFALMAVLAAFSALGLDEVQQER